MVGGRTVEEKVADLEDRAFTREERARILRAAEIVLAAQDDIRWLREERRKATRGQ